MKTGLLFTAARDLNLDLASSIMIGDALTDIMTGQAAGLRHTILVRTGRDAVQQRPVNEPAIQMKNTGQAAHWILAPAGKMGWGKAAKCC
jgi:histidinol phosphatase-like enzyme